MGRFFLYVSPDAAHVPGKGPLRTPKWPRTAMIGQHEVGAARFRPGRTLSPTVSSGVALAACHHALIERPQGTARLGGEFRVEIGVGRAVIA